MVKNTGGNKAKKGKNSGTNQTNLKREIQLPEKNDNSHIAIIKKVNGDGRYICNIIDENNIHIEDIPSHISTGIRFKYAKSIPICVNTYVLIAIRPFGKLQSDIIFVYNDMEVLQLSNNKYITLNKTETNLFEFNIESVTDNMVEINFDAI